ASNFLASGFKLTNPLTINPGPFTFQVLSLGMHQISKNDQNYALALQGSMGLSLGPTSLTLAVENPNYLFINPSFPHGFDFSGGSLAASVNFSVLNVTFDASITVSLTFGNEGNSIHEVSMFGSVAVTTSASADSNYNLNFSASMGSSTDNPGL